MNAVQAVALALYVFQVVYCAGNVISFGSNEYGILGRNSTQTPLVSPGPIIGNYYNDLFVSVSAGYKHAIYLTTSGKVYGTGSAENGVLGLNSTVSGNYPIPVQMVDGNNVLAGKKIIQAEAGSITTVLLTDDGKVYTCGTNTYGGLGVNDATVHLSPKQITMDGALAGKSVASISVGQDTVFLITTDGELGSFGAGTTYLLGDSGTSNQYTAFKPTAGVLSQTNRVFVQVSVGTGHVLALQNSGTIVSWGVHHEYLGRTGDNRLPSEVADTNNVLGGRKIVYVSAGVAGANMVIADDGKAFTFGMNVLGQLCTGDLKNTDRMKPISYAGNETFVKAKHGVMFVMLLTSTGKVFVCGTNNRGQLGLNYTSSTNIVVPTEVSLPGVATNIGDGTIESGFIVLSKGLTSETVVDPDPNGAPVVVTNNTSGMDAGLIMWVFMLSVLAVVA